MVRIIVTSLFFISAIALIGCGSSTQEPGAELDNESAAVATVVGDSDSDGQYVSLLASWATSYETTEDMYKDADLVVRGTVAGIKGITIDEQTVGRLSNSLMFTDFEFDVSEVFKGKPSGDPIIVHQTGGSTRDITKEVSDDPIFEIGADYMLFLKAVPEGLYAVLGGPDGRLVIDNDVVVSLSEAYPDRNIQDLYLEDIPIGQFEEALRSRDGISPSPVSPPGGS